jgi:DNA-directed RNA polymerase subunit E"
MAGDRLACRECHYVNDPDAQTCDHCGSSALTEDWAGYVVIADMNVSKPGSYALKVR